MFLKLANAILILHIEIYDNYIEFIVSIHIQLFITLLGNVGLYT
jgi:hypothetical protein